MHFAGGKMLKACFVFLLKNPAYGRLDTEAFCRKISGFALLMKN